VRRWWTPTASVMSSLQQEASCLPLWHKAEPESDDVVMVQSEGGEAERRVRRFRSVSEKRQIVGLTFEPGASVALVARAHGVNANQVFKWRRAVLRQSVP
jgi:hypothetical protein